MFQQTQFRIRKIFSRFVIPVVIAAVTVAVAGFGLAVAEESKDLLQQVALPRDAVAGTWSWDRESVRFHGDAGWARLVLPGRVPDKYCLSLRVTREAGDQIFVLGLVAGGKTTTVLIDGWGGGVAGIDRIKGLSGKDNASTHRGFRFTNGKPTDIECAVNANLIRVSCDGEVLIDWHGDFATLSAAEDWKVPGDNSLFIGAWKPSPFIVDKVRLTPLKREPQRTAFAPPPGKCLLCIGEDANAIDEYVEAMPHVPAGFMVRTHLGAWNDRVMGVERLELDGIQDFNVATKNPNTFLQVGLVFGDCQRDVIAGKYDHKIRSLANWFKKAQIPIYLRVGVEFNHPGSDLQCGHEPDGYKEAFAHVRRIIDDNGATNVRYVWHAFTYPRLAEMKKVRRWYPGDESVDWFGVSIYSDMPGKPKDLPGILKSAKWFADEAKRRGKPFMIAEAGIRGGNARWQKFSHDLFDFIKANNVAMLCLISEDFEKRPNYRGKGLGDMRVHVPPVKKKWSEQVREQGLLFSDEALFKKIGFVAD